MGKENLFELNIFSSELSFSLPKDHWYLEL